MSSEPSFETLMIRLQAGEQDAATQLFQRFAGRLIALARSRLDRLVQQKVDPEDVMLSVMKSFFLRHKEGHWSLASWDNLWSLLALMTVRKCGRRARYYHGGCRDVRRETSPRTEEDGSSSDWEVLDREPTPEEATMLTETVEELLRDLEGYHRDIVRLALEGCSPLQIADEVKVTERTVQRVLKRVRERLEKHLVENSDDHGK